MKEIQLPSETTPVDWKILFHTDHFINNTNIAILSKMALESARNADLNTYHTLKEEQQSFRRSLIEEEYDEKSAAAMEKNVHEINELILKSLSKFEQIRFKYYRAVESIQIEEGQILEQQAYVLDSRLNLLSARREVRLKIYQLIKSKFREWFKFGQILTNHEFEKSDEKLLSSNDIVGLAENAINLIILVYCYPAEINESFEAWYEGVEGEKNGLKSALNNYKHELLDFAEAYQRKHGNTSSSSSYSDSINQWFRELNSGILTDLCYEKPVKPPTASSFFDKLKDDESYKKWKEKYELADKKFTNSRFKYWQKLHYFDEKKRVYQKAEKEFKELNQSSSNYKSAKEAMESRRQAYRNILLEKNKSLREMKLDSLDRKMYKKYAQNAKKAFYNKSKYHKWKEKLQSEPAILAHSEHTQNYLGNLLGLILTNGKLEEPEVVNKQLLEAVVKDIAEGLAGCIPVVGPFIKGLAGGMVAGIFFEEKEREPTEVEKLQEHLDEKFQELDKKLDEIVDKILNKVDYYFKKNDANNSLQKVYDEISSKKDIIKTVVEKSINNQLFNYTKFKALGENDRSEILNFLTHFELYIQEIIKKLTGLGIAAFISPELKAQRDVVWFSKQSFFGTLQELHKTHPEAYSALRLKIDMEEISEIVSSYLDLLNQTRQQISKACAYFSSCSEEYRLVLLTNENEIPSPYYDMITGDREIELNGVAIALGLEKGSRLTGEDKSTALSYLDSIKKSTNTVFETVAGGMLNKTFEDIIQAQNRLYYLKVCPDKKVQFDGQPCSAGRGAYGLYVDNRDFFNTSIPITTGILVDYVGEGAIQFRGIGNIDGRYLSQKMVEPYSKAGVRKFFLFKNEKSNYAPVNLHPTLSDKKDISGLVLLDAKKEAYSFCSEWYSGTEKHNYYFVKNQELGTNSTHFNRDFVFLTNWTLYKYQMQGHQMNKVLAGKDRLFFISNDQLINDKKYWYDDLFYLIFDSKKGALEVRFAPFDDYIVWSIKSKTGEKAIKADVQSDGALTLYDKQKKVVWRAQVNNHKKYYEDSVKKAIEWRKKLIEKHNQNPDYTEEELVVPNFLYHYELIKEQLIDKEKKAKETIYQQLKFVGIGSYRFYKNLGENWSVNLLYFTSIKPSYSKTARFYFYSNQKEILDIDIKEDNSRSHGSMLQFTMPKEISEIKLTYFPKKINRDVLLKEPTQKVCINKNLFSEYTELNFYYIINEQQKKQALKLYVYWHKAQYSS